MEKLGIHIQIESSIVEIGELKWTEISKMANPVAQSSSLVENEGRAIEEIGVGFDVDLLAGAEKADIAAFGELNVVLKVNWSPAEAVDSAVEENRVYSASKL